MTYTPMPEPEGAVSIHGAQEALMKQLSGDVVGDSGPPETAPPKDTGDTADDSPESANATPEVEDTATAQPDGDETEEVEVDDPGDVSDPETEPGTQAGDEAEAFANFAEVAEAADMSLDDFLAIPHTVKRNGEDVTAPLGELIGDGLRLADYTRKTQAVAAKEKELEAEVAQRQQQKQNLHVAFQAQAEHLYSWMNAELASPAMQELRASDPESWTARQYELTQAKNEVIQSATADLQAYQAAEQEALMKRGQEAAQALRNAVPEWGEKHRDRVKSTFASYEMDEADIGKMAGQFDYRVFLMAHDLAEAREQLEAVKAQKGNVKKKLKQIRKKAPRVAAPTKGSTQAQRDGAAYARSMKKHRDDGSVQSAHDALMSKPGGFLD